MADARVIFRPRRSLRDGPSKIPTYLSIAYTLDISARFMIAAMLGRGSHALANRLIDGYWRRVLGAGHVTLQVVGDQGLGPGPFVFMSNHSSLLDIPVMMGAIPGSLRMVTKEELIKVPVWGPALKASGFIPVDRKDLKKAKLQLEQAKKILRQGIHVWLAPEGTRSRQKNHLAKFKKGGFHVAMGLGSAIVPTWIEGASEVIEPDDFGVYKNRVVEVRFGAPIATAGRKLDQMPDLMTEVRQAMVQLSGRADPQS